MTPADLEQQTVDVLVHEPAVDLRDAVVIAALDAIGVRDADARAVPEAALRAHDREDRILGPAGRRELLVDGRQESDVGAARGSRQLHRGDRLDDAARIDEALRDLEQLAPFEKERALLREEQRLAR